MILSNESQHYIISLLSPIYGKFFIANFFLSMLEELKKSNPRPIILKKNTQKISQIT
ncbi:hypothetical protein C1645_760704 [Glomus cerebriforme]|uniref:Uncharacterized protein n=1 Tax=Glomus cerebriforme TaxID=658196 RepID=A0A397TCH6_9GLOM|nr:hypothetical protein C1645_760704 [Glomus cerebriforme]